MDYDVTIDRDKYIGGSDIPAIMGISSFKSRFELLLEKAGLRESTFAGSRYTAYGNEMEPKIRSYLNECYFTTFSPSKRQNGDLRAHTDGFDGVMVAEIKTTSHTSKTVDGYKHYLVQLLFYMKEHNVLNGVLAVYERPADFSTEFDAKRCQIFDISAADYEGLTTEIYAEIDRFRADLARLKENPLLTEQDFQPVEIITIAQQVIDLEARIAKVKDLENLCKDMKQKLYDAMEKSSVKSWAMPNGTRITAVAGTPPSVKTVEEFDLAAFKKDHPELYKTYTKEVPKETGGRAGFVKITFPKE